MRCTTAVYYNSLKTVQELLRTDDLQIIPELQLSFINPFTPKI